MIKPESEYLKRFPIAVYMSLTVFLSTITFRARRNGQDKRLKFLCCSWHCCFVLWSYDGAF
jgi:hypothetical protein